MYSYFNLWFCFKLLQFEQASDQASDLTKQDTQKEETGTDDQFDMSGLVEITDFSVEFKVSNKVQTEKKITKNILTQKSLAKPYQRSTGMLNMGKQFFLWAIVVLWSL